MRRSASTAVVPSRPTAVSASRKSSRAFALIKSFGCDSDRLPRTFSRSAFDQGELSARSANQLVQPVPGSAARRSTSSMSVTVYGERLATRKRRTDSLSSVSPTPLVAALLVSVAAFNQSAVGA